MLGGSWVLSQMGIGRRHPPILREIEREAGNVGSLLTLGDEIVSASCVVLFWLVVSFPKET